MVKLMKASELAKFTKTKAAEFEQNAMNSPEFKKLVSSIETAAESGKYGVSIDIAEFGGTEKVSLFVKYLKEADYKVAWIGTSLNIAWVEVD